MPYVNHYWGVPEKLSVWFWEINFIHTHTHTHTHKYTPGRRPGKSVKFCHWEQVTWTCLVTVRLKYIIIYNINIYTHKYTNTHTQLLAVTKDK